MRKKAIIFALIRSDSSWEIARRSACEKSSKNRCNPYLDTVENGSGPGKFGTYDPRFDAKARNLTPNFCDFDPSQKARSDRLCRAL